MPLGWILRSGPHRLRILPRADAGSGPREPHERVVSRLRGWLADPASRTVLLDLYKRLASSPSLPADPNRVDRIVHARLEMAFRQGELVAFPLTTDGGGGPAAPPGEPAPPPPASPAEKKKTYAIVWKKPQENDIHLVGDKVEVKAVVTEDGAETNRPVTYSSGVEKGLYLLDSAGVFTLTASNSEVSVSGSVKVKAIRPWIGKVESSGPDVYAVYAPKGGSDQTGLVETDLYDPKPTTLVPTVAKMGTKVSLKLTIQGSESLTDPAEIEVAVTSPKNCDDTETDFQSEGFANQPLRWKGTGTVSKLNEDVVSTDADRPIPKRVCRFIWEKIWTYRVKWPDGQWSHTDEDPRKWRALGGPKEFFLYGVWNAPKKGGAFTLKPKEYDHFHIDKACLFGEGAFHLKLCGKWSIPYKVDNRMGHYQWPADYRFFDGNDPAKPDAKPANYTKLKKHPDSLHYADMDSPAMKDFNWGWAVLDNPRGAGGRCNQQAALVAAILNTLGIDAKGRHYTSRWGTKGGGLIDAMHDNHDPTTFGAPCFVRESGAWDRDQGWNFHGICIVNTEGAESEETQYDGSFSSPYTGSWDGVGACESDHLFGYRVGRKHSHKSIAIKTTHDLRPPAEREGTRCRCGHEMTSTDRVCPGLEITKPDGTKERTPCGAQPNSVYSCSQCGTGRLTRAQSKCPKCGKKLKALYGECLIAPCPNPACRKTVHDSMTKCWACDTPLPPVSYLTS